MDSSVEIRLGFVRKVYTILCTSSHPLPSYATFSAWLTLFPRIIGTQIVGTLDLSYTLRSL
jgi:hypothetical protein